MVMKFSAKKEKSIVCCILDTVESCKSMTARETCVNLTDFLIHRFDLYKFDILIDKNEDALLNAAANAGYSHAVVIAAGTSIGLSDRIFSAIEKQCKEDFFIAGHILDRGDSAWYKKNACFEMHQQFYIVNLKQFADAGRPFVGDEEWGDYTQNEPLRSAEYLYNDKEIPVWIKRGKKSRTYSVRLHGWNILNVGLDQDRKLLTLGPEIRDSKKYLYYEHDHVFLRQLPSIKHQAFFCNNFFAGWNSDSLRETIPFVGSVEQYATVGIGFNWIKNLQMLNFTKDTRVIFTDINNNCLTFMKQMVEKWDGNDYAAFYWANKPMFPNGSPHIGDEYKDQIAEQWDKFLSTFDDWKGTWKKIKKLKFEFVLIDYTATFNFNWLEQGKNTLLNLSDLYNHSPFVASNSVKYRIACENNLIQKLKKYDPNITLMLTSRAADGFWREKNYRQVAKVSEFTYTNIEQLKTPRWHKNEWVLVNCGRELGLD